MKRQKRSPRSFRSRKFTKPGRKTTRRRQSSKHIPKTPAQITIANGRVVMLLPRRLRSYNRKGGHWSEYSDRKAWTTLLSKALVESDGSFTLPAKARIRVEFVRLAPYKKWLLDKENLEISGKRLTDTLVELGYLVDDRRQWCDGPWLTQGVSQDKCYWTIVTLSVAVPFQEADDVVISPLEEVKRRLTSSALRVTKSRQKANTCALSSRHEEDADRCDRRARDVRSRQGSNTQHALDKRQARLRAARSRTTTGVDTRRGRSHHGSRLQGSKQ